MSSPGQAAKMKEMYKSRYARSGDATVELLSMDGADKARIRVGLTGTTNAHGMACGFSPVETEASRDGDGWSFALRSRYCDAKWKISIKPVEGKQRFEGTYSTDLPSSGTVYYEW